MQIDWWTLALQTVNFLIVVWLLSRFLYRPVRRAIEAREAADRQAAEAARTAQAEAEAARAGYEREREAMGATLREKEAALHAEMEAEREAERKAAEAKAEALLSDARTRIEAERAEALRALSGRIAGLAREMAKAALDGGGVAPGTLDRVAGHLDGLDAAERAELAADALGGPGLAVVSAAALDEAEAARWRAALAARLGEGAVLRFETDPALLGGVELRFPHAVLAFSVSDRLERAAARLKEA